MTDAPPRVDGKDLNALVPVDKTVFFGKPEPRPFLIPGDMPMDIYLHVQCAMLESTDEVEGTKHFHAALVKLLTWYDKDEDTQSFVTRNVTALGVRTMMKILNGIYEDDDEKAEDEQSPPVEAPATAPTPTTTGDSSTEASPTPPVLVETPSVT